MTSHGERAGSFERGAADYAASRPDYPDAAVDWAIPPGARDVLDLAAGTGKLTASLVARGLDVVAVEPSAAMRAELTRLLPDVRALAGTADATGLPDASVDAVTVAQAWHWFAPATASAEIARVLRPRGRVTVLWNVRDEAEPWVAAFGEILHRGDPMPTHYVQPAFGGELEAIEAAEFRWTQRFRPANLRALAASRSFLLTMAPDERESRLAEVDALVATHPALAGQDVVDLPHVTRAWRASRR
ncbi:class I SAM-dependent methyltransferase [Cellulomonas sp. PhB150]|uniref:class I SAM-dependent methyltransferase n=1 Tax=Cellulomonas sp. PhB150 TaxID=2485188 RepID=UPI000F477095|nr:class I SAM-dependent methyltransferase [Cellulomonas sp. PhB150]ROS27788.1 methyltransferase family protein [Cellulomonas sp. PhB150]